MSTKLFCRIICLTALLSSSCTSETPPSLAGVEVVIAPFYRDRPDTCIVLNLQTTELRRIHRPYGAEVTWSRFKSQDGLGKYFPAPAPATVIEFLAEMGKLPEWANRDSSAAALGRSFKSRDGVYVALEYTLNSMWPGMKTDIGGKEYHADMSASRYEVILLYNTSTQSLTYVDGGPTRSNDGLTYLNGFYVQGFADDTYLYTGTNSTAKRFHLDTGELEEIPGLKEVIPSRGSSILVGRQAGHEDVTLLDGNLDTLHSPVLIPVNVLHQAISLDSTWLAISYMNAEGVFGSSRASQMGISIVNIRSGESQVVVKEMTRGEMIDLIRK